MKTILKHKLEKLFLLFSDFSELEREVRIRLNANRVSRGFRNSTVSAPFPTVVLLVVNDSCNQRCRICDLGRRVESSFYYQSHFKNKGNMEKETFKAIVDSVKGHKTELWFLATEPLLYQDLLWAINYAAAYGIDSQITTNGYLLPDMAEELIRCGIKRICISIDGYSPQLHDFIRDCPGSYERAKRGLQLLIETKKKLRKRRPHIVITAAISQWNYDSLEKLVETFYKYDLDGITFSHLQFLTEEMAQLHSKIHKEFPITGRNISGNDRNAIDTGILFRELGKIKKKYKKYWINIGPDLKNYEQIQTYYFSPDKPIEGHSICYMPWRYPHILPNGDVVVNYECFNHPMGNINEENLSSIWNGRKFNDFRAFIRKNNGSTPACWRCPMIYCGYKL